MSVNLSLEALAAIIDRMRAALSRGLDVIVYQGEPLPVSEPNLRVLEDLQKSAQPLESLPPEPEKGNQDVEPPPPETAKEKIDPIALLIARHLESLEAKLVSRKPPVVEVGFSIEGLRTNLLPHQEVGLRWLQDHWLTSRNPLA